MNISANDPNVFLELYSTGLERQAQRWVKHFHDVPITKITLYRTFHKHKRELQKSEWYKQLSDERKKAIGASRYAVVFQVDYIDGKQDDSLLTIDDIKSRVTNQQKEHPFYELRRKTNEHNYSLNPDSIFIDSDFRSVYFGGPVNSDFHKEWLFFVLDSNCNLPSIIAKDEPVIELYNINTIQEPHFNMDETVRDAVRNGYMSLGHLYYIMAQDKQYTPDLINNLWKKYECFIRGPKEPHLDTFQDRFGAWFDILDRLAFGRVKGIPITKSSPPYLPLHQFNHEEGSLEKYDRIKKPYDPQVKLEDLKKYFTEIIEIPLPTLLFTVELESTQEMVVENRSEEESTYLNNTKYPDEVVQLIGGMKSEIDRLYACMISNLVNEPENEDYKVAILECYKSGLYEKIKKEYLDDDFLYYHGEKDVIETRHLIRNFIGKLCQIIISDHFPKRLPDKNKPPKGYGVKRLYENLYKKI